MITPVAAGVAGPAAVVFDLGGVLIDWDPRHLYRRLMPDAEVEDFLAEIDFMAWNHAQDAGGDWSSAVTAHGDRFPHRRELIAAYPERFPDTIRGPIEGTVALLQELHATGVRLLALTNWSAETFPYAEATFEFLELFEGIVVSGREGVAKPDPGVFRRLVQRFGLDPSRTVFVDDSPVNVAAGDRAGLTALLFRDAAGLRADLTRLGLLGRPGGATH